MLSGHWASSGASARWILAALLIAITAIAPPVPAVGATGGSSGADGRRGSAEDMVQAAIVGGSDAPRGRYPYAVSLHSNRRHFCGGSLIHPRVVLTAAHCFYNSDGRPSGPGYWKPLARIGAYKREGGTFDRRWAVRVVVHPRYSPKTQENDVALVLLGRPSTKATLRLPSARPSPAVVPGTMLTAIGWGRTEDKGPPAGVLQEAPLMLLNFPTCKIYMPDERWGLNSMLCAGQPSLGRDTCTGDSGGPLLLKDPLGRPKQDLQVAIVSWGYKCGGWRPGVYTNLATVSGWVRATTKKLAATRRAPGARRGLLSSACGMQTL